MDYPVVLDSENTFQSFAVADVEASRKLAGPKSHQLNHKQWHLAFDLIKFTEPDCRGIIVLGEPVDRIVSHFSYARKIRDHYLPDIIVERALSPKEKARSGWSVYLSKS